MLFFLFPFSHLSSVLVVAHQNIFMMNALKSLCLNSNTRAILLSISANFLALGVMNDFLLKHNYCSSRKTGVLPHYSQVQMEAGSLYSVPLQLAEDTLSLLSISQSSASSLILHWCTHPKWERNGDLDASQEVH